MWSKPPVAKSADFVRIKNLPIRTDETYPAGLEKTMTDLLKTKGAPAYGELYVPHGKTKAIPFGLRPVQARALFDLGEAYKGFFPIRVGGGKCLGRGTPVLMFDGTIKPAEEVAVGDLLMGPDSRPRTVVSTCTGREEMFRITPVKGEPYVVNASHILSLKQTPMGGGDLPCQVGGRVRNLTVREFVAESEWFRDNWKGYRVGVDFAPQRAIEPYMLGVWLGDGTTATPSITSADIEIVEEIDAFARRWEVGVRVQDLPGNAAKTYHFNTGRTGGHGRNPVSNWLAALGVIGNKHVPQAYKSNSRHVRLEVLAGLLDTDGSLGHGFDFIAKNERLADDVCFLSRSLGFAAYKSPCQKSCQTGAVGTYYRVSISGDIAEIPCRISRKKAPKRQQKKSVLVTGLSAESLGEGDYFGFELAGPDRLFLLGDFTVTHNTLVSFLAARVVGAARPVLVLPASLIEKTEREWATDMRYWRVSKQLRFLSYEKLGRVSGADTLDGQQGGINPDMIIADEAHRLKNLRAAVTRRFSRYMAKNPKTIFVPMSGTIMKSSIKDFAHLLEWSHRDTSPLPLYNQTLLEWSEALDEKVNPLSRRSPGVLLDLMPHAPEVPRGVPEVITDRNKAVVVPSTGVEFFVQDDEEVRTARRLFFARANATQGIISADAKDDYQGSLEIDALEYPANAATEANFELLRSEWKRPDGWTLTEAFQLWAVARMIALGLHYEWQPGAPEGWLEARKQYAAHVRDLLADGLTSQMGIDSELQVTNAISDGKLPDPYGLLPAWRAVKGTFTANPVPVWHDQTALNVCADWLKGRTEGVVWIAHNHFARELSKRTGVPFFGAKGLDPRGNFIEDHDGPVIASLAANSTGRNIQYKHSSGLYTAPPADSERWEQSLGRLHREGQPADSVSVQVLVGCKEHLDSIPRALASSQVKTDILGASQKIMLADILWPDTHVARSGRRWG